MNIVKVIFLGIVFLIVACMVTKWNYDTHISEIKQWTKNHNLKMGDYEINHTIFGSPFYYLNDGCVIYEVDVTTQDDKSKRLWVRDNGLFSDDYIIE